MFRFPDAVSKPNRQQVLKIPICSLAIFGSIYYGRFRAEETKRFTEYDCNPENEIPSFPSPTATGHSRRFSATGQSLEAARIHYTMDRRAI